MGPIPPALVILALLLAALAMAANGQLLLGLAMHLLAAWVATLAWWPQQL